MNDNGILKQYLKSVSVYPRITPEEEIQLSRKIKDGDSVALNQVVNANLKLVVKIALEMCRNSNALMDMIQNGNMGLMKAAKKFNPELGVRFSTYSSFWIKQAIMRGFVKPGNNVSISYRKDEINRKLKNYIKDYYKINMNLPTVDQLIGDLKVSRRDAVDILTQFKSNGELAGYNSSTDAGEETIEQVHDYSYNPEAVFEKIEMEQNLHEVLNSFPERESDIIKKRYGIDQDEKDTLNEIGQKYNISAEATRQIEKKVLLQIKNRFPGLAHYIYAA